MPSGTAVEFGVEIGDYRGGVRVHDGVGSRSGRPMEADRAPIETVVSAPHFHEHGLRRSARCANRGGGELALKGF
jgi:hypothetical protein